MGHQVKYSVTSTDLLTTKCEHTGYLIGGYDCVNCKHFSYKNKKFSYVVCSMKHTKK